jgi:ribose-phosphate pyrophosphokinase
MSYGKIAIVDVSPDKTFSQNVAQLVDVAAHDTKVDKFKDGETHIMIRPSVRGRDVYVFQSYTPPLGERFYELLNGVSATQSGGEASRITAVMPYCFGMRGERPTGPRESTQSVVVAKALASMGVDKVVTVGLHSDAVQSVFLATGIKVEQLSFEPLAANYIINTAREKGYNHIVLASPDAGGTKRVRRLRDIVAEQYPGLNTDIVIGDKQRKQADKPEIVEIVGDPKGKIIFLYDDIADTLGTLRGIVQALKERGANAIYLINIHPVFGRGYERNLASLCDDRFVREIVVGNTIPIKEDALECQKLRVIPVEPFVAAAITRINQDKSMSELHKYKEILKIYESCPIKFNGRSVQIGNLEEILKREKVTV